MPAYKVCPTCGRLSQGSYCPEHRRTYNYPTAHWAQIRRTRLAYDNHTCQLNLPGCTHQADTVHLDPTLNGNHLHATLYNTRSACRHCHGTLDGARAGQTTRR